MTSLLRRSPLAAYFALAYAITWVLLLPLAASSQGWLPLHVPAAWHALGALGPFLAALIVTAAVGGRREVRRWLGGFARWRVGARWWLLAGAGPFALFGACALAVRLAGAPWPDFARLASPAFANAHWLLDVLFVGTVAYALGEEPGWRGFALPRLERRWGPLVGTLALWPLWALWHWPAFLYRPAYQGGLPTIGGFLFGLLAGAIILTFLYDGSGGSLPVVIAFHAFINIVMQVAAVISPATLAAMNMVLAVGAVAVAVWWVRGYRARRAMAAGPPPDGPGMGAAAWRYPTP